ncbi:hypothetical protein D3C76_1298450 [compost metagenome]
MDQPREQVAAEFVGAEEELRLATFQPYRRGEQEVAELLARVEWRDPRREQRAEHDQAHEQQAADRALVVREGLPELFQGRGVNQARVAGGSALRNSHLQAPYL